MQQSTCLGMLLMLGARFSAIITVVAVEDCSSAGVPVVLVQKAKDLISKEDVDLGPDPVQLGDCAIYRSDQTNSQAQVYCISGRNASTCAIEKLDEETRMQTKFSDGGEESCGKMMSVNRQKCKHRCAQKFLETDQAGCRMDADLCYSQTDRCCGSSICVGWTDTTPGVCVDRKRILLKCLWTAKGMEFAKDEYSCDQDEARLFSATRFCPRLGDPVNRATWLNNGEPLDNDDLEEMEENEFVVCQAFHEKCYWTAEGVQPFQDCKANAPYMDGRGVDYCPVEGQQVTFEQSIRFLNTEIRSSWAEYAEQGMLRCVNPLQAYVAWKTSVEKPRSQHVQCGNLPYNCVTKEQARQACKKWSANPAVPGSGRGELCFKQELGEAVGANCRPMWTEDSVGKEGCYESPGRVDDPIDPEYVRIMEEINKWSDRDYSPECHPVAGEVACITMPENPPAEPAVMFPLKPEHQIGWDAACCEGHFKLELPYYLGGGFKK